MSRYASVHKDPQGPGDARPTATQVIEDEGMVDGLKGKTILITGGSSGLGTETARVLETTGAKVFMTARQMAKAEELAKSMSTDPSHPPVSVIEMSLDSLESVRKGAQQFLKESGGKCNILICNAGVMASPEGRTADGFETQFGTNHIAHFLLFDLLKQALLDSSSSEFPSRVVAVSSSGHRIGGIKPDNYNLEGDYNAWTAYGQSKTANIYLANEIERRYGSRGVHGLSLHPGAIGTTELSRHTSSDPVVVKTIRGNPLYKLYSKSIPQGAATQVWAAVSKELSGKGGVYLDNVQVAEKVSDEATMFSPGYAPHAYDVDMAKRLWTDSCKLAGVEDKE